MPAAGAASSNGGEVVQVVDPLKKRGRLPGSKDVRPRKRVAMTQNNPLLIDTQNPSHENIMDYDYVQHTSLEDASSLEPICGVSIS